MQAKMISWTFTLHAFSVSISDPELPDNDMPDFLIEGHRLLAPGFGVKR